ncbi:MAG: ferric uptake regulator, Fur family [Actinobacteria bacterium]|nr:ferric uptake regulator, Fur family [Actinomycetota bacterium]
MKTSGIEIGRRLDRFKAASRKSGVKLTHQRLEIFREIAGSTEHPDAETVFRGVRSRVPTVSLDTVYRTLWLLDGLGLISTLGPRRESVRFDPNLEHHHHYVCLRCGLAKDFESADLNVLAIPASVKKYGSVLTTHVEVRGYCSPCGKETISRKTPATKQSRRKPLIQGGER